MDNTLTILKNIIAAELKAEGITEDDLSLVDLNIMFSPVIPFRGGTINDAVEVTETTGGKFIVHHPLIKDAVDVEILRVMRYRYLISRQK